MTFKIGLFEPTTTPQLTVRDLLLDLHAGASSSDDFVVDFACDGVDTGDIDENEAVITIGDDLLQLLEEESKDMLNGECFSIIAETLPLCKSHS